MTNPTNPTRALALGVLLIGVFTLASCNVDEQALWNDAAKAAQTDMFMKIAATRSTNAPSDQTLANLRECESHGDYGAVSRSGSYRGAYQFSRSTWDNVARNVLPVFAGTDPAVAPPHVQDAMARALWAATGSRSWPHCGRRA